MKKLVFTAVAAMAAVALVAPAAVAGEITGNGRPKEVHGRSICAFSGLNDSVSPEEPHRTQSFGTVVRDFAKAGEVSAVARMGIGGRSGTTGVGIPGNACNPNAGFEE